MKDLLIPILASIAMAIIMSLASLFGDVHSNKDDIEVVVRDTDRLRGFIIENHDNIIKLQKDLECKE